MRQHRAFPHQRKAIANGVAQSPGLRHHGRALGFILWLDVTQKMTKAAANKELMRRFWKAFLADNGGLSDLVMPDCAFRGTLGLSVTGPSGMAEYATQVNDVFEGFSIRVGQMVSEGDTIMARLQFSGTHHAELFGVPPTGKLVSYPGVAIGQVNQGRFSEMWVTGDAASWMAAFQRLSDG